MPKLKVHSGTKDRVRITRNGKALVRHATGNHFLRKKSAARKRQFAGTKTLDGKQSKNMKKRLGE